jgi:hypothetical protein
MAQTGYTPILNYSSATASAVPLAANLAQGELALNTNDGRLFYKDSAGVVQTMASKATGAIGGSNTQVQFNNSGVLGGSANLTFNGTTLTAAGLAGPLNGTVGATTPAAGSFTTLTTSSTITDNGGTANGVTYLNGSKVVTSGSTLTFDGNKLSATTGVGGNSNVLSLINSNAAAGGQGVGIFGYSSNGSNTLGSIQFGGQGALGGNLDFSTANSSGTNNLNMRLDSSGNLGIGTTTPTSLLQTAGTSAKSAFKTPNIAEVNTVSATAASGTIQYDVTTQSVLYYTSNASANWTVNFRGSSGTSLNTVMQTGESISVTFLATQGATAYYNSAVTIDGNSVTPKWQGGTAPTSGNANSIDSYNFVIIKVGSGSFTVLASVTKFA